MTIFINIDVGNICEISKKEVVVDDIVVLELGEEVPADAVLLESVSLQINESTLTGEPVVSKTTNEDDFDADATYPSNGMIFNDKGTLKLYRVGNYVSGCWTNMPNTNNNAYRFYFDYANLNLRNANARIIGHAVRCMKDTDY